MGELNAAVTFVSMMKKLQNEWDKLSKEREMKNAASKTIVNDVLLYVCTS